VFRQESDFRSGAGRRAIRVLRETGRHWPREEFAMHFLVPGFHSLVRVPGAHTGPWDRTPYFYLRHLHQRSNFDRFRLIRNDV